MVTNRAPSREKTVQHVCFGLLFAAVQIGIFGPPLFRVVTLAIGASRSFVTHTLVATLGATAH